MVELGFSTGISGITKPAVSGVSSTQVQSFPATVKTQISQKIKPKKIGKLKPITTEDNDIVSLGIDLFTQTKSGDVIMNEYLPKLSTGTFDNVMGLANDISAGSGKQELIKAYPNITKDVVIDLYDANQSITNPPGLLKNYVTGLAGQIPKIIGNFLKFSASKLPGQDLVSIMKQGIESELQNKLQEGKITDEEYNKGIKYIGGVLPQIESLANDAQQEIVDYIGGDKESIPYKMGQLTTEIAPFFLIPGVGGARAGAIGGELITDTVIKNMPKLEKFITSPLVQKIIRKTISSVPSTEVSSITSEGRLSKPGELAAGAVVQNIIPSKMLNKEKSLTNAISERPTSVNLRKGLEQGDLGELPGKVRSRWSGVGNVLKASQRSKDAIQTITKEIKNYSKEPQKLYNQIKEKISDIASGLSEDLKKINVSGMTKMKKQIEDTFIRVSDEAADYSKPIVKDINIVLGDLKKAKTLNDVWEVAKKLDKLMPSSIKKGIGKGGKDELLYGKWRESRNAVNTALEDFAYNLPDGNVKDALKKMSNLYHGMEQIRENVPELYKQKPGIKQGIQYLAKQGTKYYLLGKMLGITGGEKARTSTVE